MATGLEGHRSAPSRRRTRRPANGCGEGATPGDGAAARHRAADGEASPTRRGPVPAETGGAGDVLAALDLGTNNCRLLVARPDGDGFRVIDAFSRIVRLGEGLSRTGSLSRGAMDRAIAALSICAQKLSARDVDLGRARLIATEACRSAANGVEFIEQVP